MDRIEWPLWAWNGEQRVLASPWHWRWMTHFNAFIFQKDHLTQLKWSVASLKAKGWQLSKRKNISHHQSSPVDLLSVAAPAFHQIQASIDRSATAHSIIEISISTAVCSASACASPIIVLPRQHLSPWEEGLQSWQRSLLAVFAESAFMRGEALSESTDHMWSNVSAFITSLATLLEAEAVQSLLPVSCSKWADCCGANDYGPSAPCFVSFWVLVDWSVSEHLLDAKSAEQKGTNAWKLFRVLWYTPALHLHLWGNYGVAKTDICYCNVLLPDVITEIPQIRSDAEWRTTQNRSAFSVIIRQTSRQSDPCLLMVRSGVCQYYSPAAKTRCAWHELWFKDPQSNGGHKH